MLLLLVYLQVVLKNLEYLQLQLQLHHLYQLLELRQLHLE
jgi:hypothetical protein